MNYSGEDNLEVMEGATVYNGYLLKMLQQTISERDSLILDFGAGTGFYAQKVQASYPNKRIVALEPASNLAHYYQKTSIEKITSLAEVSQVDVVYSFNVLEHIEDDMSVLKDLYGILKAGGRLCLFVPAFPVLLSAMDKKVGHYRRYTRRELFDKVEKVGFKVRTCIYKDFCGWFVSFVYKWLGNASGDINPKMLWFYDKFVMPVSILFDYLTRGKVCGKNIWLEAEK